MKHLQTTFPALCTKWVSTGWMILTGRPPEPPPAESTPKEAQVEADQEWEDEGGSCKPAKKPGAEPAPKIPL